LYPSTVSAIVVAAVEVVLPLADGEEGLGFPGGVAVRGARRAPQPQKELALPRPFH
jgi:hypothetical protein